MKLMILRGAFLCAMLPLSSPAYANEEAEAILVVGQRERPIEIEPRGLRVSAGVDNLTNSKDFVFHPYPQRTFLIEAGVKL